MDLILSSPYYLPAAAASRRWSNSDMSTTIPISENIYRCLNNCGRSYKLLSSLQRHLTFECNVPKKFMCEVCLKSYTRKESLKFHMTEKHSKKIEEMVSDLKFNKHTKITNFKKSQ